MPDSKSFGVRVPLPKSAGGIVANVLAAFIDGVLASWGVMMGGLAGGVMLAGAILALGFVAIGARYAMLAAFYAGGAAALERAQDAMEQAEREAREAAERGQETEG